MVSNVYPDHRYFFLESGNSDNDLQLGVIQQWEENKFLSSTVAAKRAKLNCLGSLYICRTHYSYCKYREVPSRCKETKYQKSGFISKIDRGCHRDLILGFQKGKSAQNESEISDFQNLPKTCLKVLFNSNRCQQVSKPPDLGNASDKNLSSFLDLGVRSPFLWHPKTATFGDFMWQIIGPLTTKSWLLVHIWFPHLVRQLNLGRQVQKIFLAFEKHPMLHCQLHLQHF